MVEPILFILAGVFSSAIVALFITHAVWQRAVRLTTQRVMRYAPVSRSDMVASGDMIRAENAVQLVKIERKLHTSSSKAAEYLAEIGRKIVAQTELTTKFAQSSAENVKKQARIDALISNLDHMQAALSKTHAKLTENNDQLRVSTAKLNMLEQRYTAVATETSRQKEHITALENILSEARQQMAIAHKEAQQASAHLKQEIAARLTAENTLAHAKAHIRDEMANHMGELEAQLERLKVEKAMLEGVVSSVRARKRKAVAAARAETAALFEDLPSNTDSEQERPELPNMSDVHILTNRLAARQSKKMVATAANDASIADMVVKK